MQEEGTVEKRLKASNKFVIILALVSIISFIGIVSETLFDFNMGLYIEALWMFVIGIGFVLEGQITIFRKVRLEGLTPTNFTHLTTVIIGFIAIITGIFSIPFIRIEQSGFLAVKGIISLIAIIVIVVQTWVIK
jgi:hypothetical protein